MNNPLKKTLKIVIVANKIISLTDKEAFLT